MSRKSPRKDFIKSTVIGFGFLTGFWMHLGFDPQSFVFSILQKLLIMVQPQYTPLITFFFFALPIVLTASTLLFAYWKTGKLGLFAVALAFAAGVLLNMYSLPLLAAAIVFGFLVGR